MSGPGDPYECDICHGQFLRTVTDEEARAEQQATWQPRPGGDGIACDDCYQELMEWARTHHPEYLR